MICGHTRILLGDPVPNLADPPLGMLLSHVRWLEERPGKSHSQVRSLSTSAVGAGERSQNGSREGAESLIGSNEPCARA